MWSHTVRDLNGADLMFYMGTHGSWQWGHGGGKAYMRAVCKTRKSQQKYKAGVGHWGSIPAMVGGMVSHEIGHNLGMQHDHHKSHGGTGNHLTSTNACNHQGVMSYGKSPKQWSECSVQDFTAHYNSLKDNWCLPGKFFLIEKLCNCKHCQAKAIQGNFYFSFSYKGGSEKNCGNDKFLFIDFFLYEVHVKNSR